MSTVDIMQDDGGPSLARQIKGVMAHRRLTMRSLSELAGIPYGTLQGYLLGRHPMPAEALGRIADVLQVSTDWLVFKRPATFDNHSVAVAISKLDDMRSAAGKAGQEMSLLSLAQLFADFYKDEYVRLHCAGVAGKGANASGGRSGRKR